MGHNLTPGYYVIDHRDGSVVGGPFLKAEYAEANAGVCPCAILYITGKAGDVLSWLCGVPTCEEFDAEVARIHEAAAEPGRDTQADIAAFEERVRNLAENGVVLGEATYINPEPYTGPTCAVRPELYGEGEVTPFYGGPEDADEEPEGSTEE